MKHALKLRLIKRSQFITEKIFKKLKRILKIGMSEKRIARLVKLYSRRFGADNISFKPIIAINSHSAFPHHIPTNTKLKKGDLVLIDIGVVYKGFCSDMTRVIFTRPPTPLEQKIYSIVLKAQKAGIKALKAGATGKNVYMAAFNVLKKYGYERYFKHNLGHGVGLDIHESPSLSPKYKKPIPENSVVTVEPGIYLEGKFGIRIEDMVVAHKHGAANLTKTPKSIQSCVIRLK